MTTSDTGQVEALGNDKGANEMGKHPGTGMLFLAGLKTQKDIGLEVHKKSHTVAIRALTPGLPQFTQLTGLK